MDNMSSAYAEFEEEDALLMRKMDDIFRNEVVKRGALEYYVPSLVEGEVLEKCGYFNSFPQHLTVPTFVKKDYYEQVVENRKINSSQLGFHNLFLTPSACLGLYPMLEGKKLDNTIFTMNVNVFRYEDGRFDGIVRFWDFNVREVVFVGSEEYVNAMMNEFKKITQKIANDIGVPMSLTKATDFFYPTSENKIKKRFQSTNALKFEMTSSVDGKKVALGSFNYHNNHFSLPFHFDQGGKVKSACIGYGLQRWVAAVKDAGEKAINKVLESVIK